MEASHDPFKWGVSFFLLLLLSRCVYWNYIPFWWARCIDADALFFSFFLSQPNGLAHTEELAPQTICAMCRPSLVVLPLPHGAFYIFDGDFWIRLRTQVVSNVAAKKKTTKLMTITARNFSQYFCSTKSQSSSNVWRWDEKEMFAALAESFSLIAKMSKWETRNDYI